MSGFRTLYVAHGAGKSVSGKGLVPVSNRDSLRDTKERRADMLLAREVVNNFPVKPPTLLLRSARIQHSLKKIQQHLQGVRLFYAMKANPSPMVTSVVEKLGCGIDVASENELRLALREGYDGSRIVLSNPVKSDELIEQMFFHGVHSYAVDCVDEIKKVAHIARTRFPGVKSCRPLIRIRVDANGTQVDLGRKFGCHPDDAVELYRLCHDFGLDPLGLAFHVGTQCVSAETYSTALQISLRIARDIKDRAGLSIEVLNIGGGFPDAMYAEARGVSVDHLYRDIGTAIRTFEQDFRAIGPVPTFYAEPGRAVVSDSGLMLTKVLAKAIRNGQDSVHINDGIYGCFSARMVEGTDYTFTRFQASGFRSEFSSLAPFTVFGPTCDSVDTVGEGILLPRNIGSGDLLVTPNIGAYSVATACRFNGFDVPRVYLVNRSAQGEIELVDNEGQIVPKYAAKRVQNSY